MSLRILLSVLLVGLISLSLLSIPSDAGRFTPGTTTVSNASIVINITQVTGLSSTLTSKGNTSYPINISNNTDLITGTLPVASGGTGAATTAEARENLGVNANLSVSYYIYVNGSYYVRNGTTGNIDASFSTYSDAINYSQRNGNVSIQVAAGTYSLTNNALINQTNVSIMHDDNVIIQGTVNDVYYIDSLYRDGVLKVYTTGYFTRYEKAYNRSVRLVAADVAALRVGEFVYIFNDDNSGAQFNQIIAISGTTVTFNETFRYNYTDKKGKLYGFNNTVENIRIIGGTLVGGSNAIESTYGVRNEFRNIRIQNTASHAIEISAGYQHIIAGNQIYSTTGAGIHVNGGDNGHIITNNIVQGSTGIGIQLSTHSNDNIVSGNVLNGNVGGGIQISSSSDNTITNNIMNGNENDVIAIVNDAITTVIPTGNTISMNTIQYNNGPGMEIHGANLTTVVGNTIRGNGESCIGVTSGGGVASYFTAIGYNACEFNGQNNITRGDGNPYDGISIGAATYTSVDGNMLTGHPRDGIFISASAVDTKVGMANQFSLNNAITNSGSNSRFAAWNGTYS